MSLSVLPLHKHPEYLTDCCRLINDEWKRSDTARMHSLQASCDRLPTSLVLLENKTVVGHLKLTSIPSIRKACFLESVVIDRKLRGKGYGTVLMRKAEEYCKDFLSLDTIYLSTKGQEPFYSKLGYTECLPISIYGSYIPNSTAPRQKTETDKSSVVQNAPPPPPLPVTKTTTANNSTKTFMKKQI
ncbi:N-acetyltransferase 6 [Anoplophora glabripennis]|nr:N-acetyltransferase 6 [Anoplophora glabripennis]